MLGWDSDVGLCVGWKLGGGLWMEAGEVGGKDWIGIEGHFIRCSGQEGGSGLAGWEWGHIRA